MIIPMQAPLTLRRNDNPFRVMFVAENEDGSVIDMTGLSAVLEMRLYPGAPGEALISISTDDMTGSRLIASSLGLEAVIENEPIDTLPGGEAGQDVVFAYDLLVTRAGDQNCWFFGAATVKWGVTDV
jgi:hypothetical protein